MTAGLGWAVAAVLALAWLLRQRGDWEVWKGSAHLHSNRRLDEALRLCERLWSGDPADDVRAVVRRSGEELCRIDWRTEAGRRSSGRSRG